MTGLDVDLAGKRALVTGAGQGVGRQIARYLGAAGAEVMVNDIVPDRAEAVAAEISEDGKARSAVFDVTSWASVSGGLDEMGPVDILVNNAGNAGVEGWAGRGPFVETDPGEWSRFIDVNLYGVMHAARAAVPGMIERGGGRVITVVSDAGRFGDPTLAVYAAAKAGAAGFSRSLARELGRYGITVNCVALGTILPPGADPATDQTDEQIRQWLRGYVIRRRGTPDDVAAMVTFLAGPQASWITGQTYPVNGGYSFAL
jgi:NAD(P)-dependent dehydrogenase (short-subunit alcohol dehydrogenase family)